MAEKITFAIGGQEFSVSALNFEQMDAILPIVASLKEKSDASGEPGEAKSLLTVMMTTTKPLRDIVQIMVSEDYPDAKIAKLPFDLPGLRQAVTKVLAASGLATASTAPGEVQAGAGSA